MTRTSVSTGMAWVHARWSGADSRSSASARIWAGWRALRPVPVLNLLAAARSGGGDLRARRSCAHGGKQSRLGSFEGAFVVLGFVAVRARHAAAGRRNLVNALGAGQRQRLERRTERVHRLLVAVSVHQDPLRPARSAKREPARPRFGGDELLEGHDAAGDESRVVRADELRVGVADHGHAARLEPDDRNPPPDNRGKDTHVVFRRPSRIVLRPFRQHRPSAAPAAIGEADGMSRRLENPGRRLANLRLEPRHERIVKQHDGRIVARCASSAPRTSGRTAPKRMSAASAVDRYRGRIRGCGAPSCVFPPSSPAERDGTRALRCHGCRRRASTASISVRPDRTGESVVSGLRWRLRRP